MSHAYVPRVNEGGNFCGHNPAEPRLHLAKAASKKLPKLLAFAIDRLKDFYWQPSLIPSLAFICGRLRRMRSERREACYQMLAVILKFTDLASLRVGTPSDEGFAPLPVKTLADHAGLSLSRGQRAIYDLKAAGLLSVSEVSEEQKDGSYRALAAIKAINRHVFGLVGLLDKLPEQMKKANKRARKVARKMNNVTTRAKSRSALLLQSIMPRVKRTRREDPEINRRRQLRALELRGLDPGRHTEDIDRQVRQEIA